MCTTAAMTKPPAARATPPITSKPIQRPHGVVSERAVETPRPREKRTIATAAANPARIHIRPLKRNRRLLSMGVLPRSDGGGLLVHELAAALNDPVEGTHKDPHTQELERNRLQRRPGERREGLVGELAPVAPGEEVQRDVRNVEDRVAAHLVLAPDLLDVLRRLGPQALLGLGQHLAPRAEDRRLRGACSHPRRLVDLA